MEPVPQAIKKPIEDPGRSSGSGILRPVPEGPERVERPAPPDGGEDEEHDFPGIEKLFEPYGHEEAAEEPQPATPHTPQPAAPAGSALPLPGQEVHERLLPFNECWKNCATKWSFTSCM